MSEHERLGDPSHEVHGAELEREMNVLRGIVGLIRTLPEDRRSVVLGEVSALMSNEDVSSDYEDEPDEKISP